MVWRKEDRVLVSPAFSQIFQAPSGGSLVDSLSFLPPPHYNPLIQHINMLHHRKFDYIFEHEHQYYHAAGCKHDDLFVLEFQNISRHKEKERNLEAENEFLRKQNDALCKILHALPIPITYGKDKILFCNQAYAELLNRTIDRILELQERVDMQFRMARYGQIRHYVTRKVYTQDQHTIEYVLDQTDWQRLHEKYESQRHYFNHVFHQLSLPIFVLNPQLRLEFWNPAYETLLDFDPAFLQKGPTIAEILDDLYMRRKLPEPDDFQAFKNTYLEHLQNLEEVSQETLYLSNGQILRQIAIPSPSFGIIFMYEDITDYLQLMQKNKMLHDVQRETIDRLYEGILVLGSDYKIRLYNQAVEQMFQVDMVQIDHIREFLACTRGLFLHPMEPLLLTLFEKRQPFEDDLVVGERTIRWAYTPLTDGSHMLQFMTEKSFSQPLASVGAHGHCILTKKTAP